MEGTAVRRATDLAPSWLSGILKLSFQIAIHHCTLYEQRNSEQPSRSSFKIKKPLLPHFSSGSFFLLGTREAVPFVSPTSPTDE